MLLTGVFLPGALLLPLRAQQVPVVEKHLANGMRLLLVERHDEPTIAGGWVAHVGSSNERLGITGIAHLFEHMMFKGTPTIGTKDYKKTWRSSRRRNASAMRCARRTEDARGVSPRRDRRPAQAREQDRQLPGAGEGVQRAHANSAPPVKNEFDRIYSGAGGSGMNAFTTEDMTAYFVTVPANKLELWMWMESARW